MKKIKRKAAVILTALCIGITSYSSYAAPMILDTTMDSESISPKVLLTLNERVWNSDRKIQFDVTYVVDDANYRIVEVKNAYVSAKNSSVKSYSDASVYLHPQGVYANISCRYTLLDGTQGTALVEINP